MNSSPLNYGFKAFLIISLFVSCYQPSSISNSILSTSNNYLLRSSWQKVENSNTRISQLEEDCKEQILLEATDLRNIIYDETFASASAEYFLMEEYDAIIKERVFYISAGGINSISLYVMDRIYQQTMFSTSRNMLSNVDFQFRVEFTSEDGKGIHQLEYWNAYNNRLVIIDPYYGIRYIDERGNYLTSSLLKS